ncbi:MULTISPECIES: HD domain-containing phosphohydrolase [unclassified Nitrospina]|uniref:HD domain-containing phosphohydrolase n=1 Tax=unclassified Nitrospina TaxID=2638683 RepID=UPI003F95534C
MFASETHKPTILVIDDSAENVHLMVEVLKEQYNVQVATNGEGGLRLAQSENPPELILLDILMPCMDGYEVCRRLKSHPVSKNIPVIFLTALNAVHNVTKGFEVGGVDFITKPISVPIVMARVQTHLALYNQKRLLENLVREKTRELENTQDVTIAGLATLAEYRDSETGGHISRTKNYVRLLARNLRDLPRFRGELDDEVIDLLYKSAPLHDIGKVGVQDRILRKPGRLTYDETREMDKHVVYGRDAILEAERRLGKENNRYSFLRYAREIAYSHHERWDGTGYPDKLKGDEIPVSARLMAVADVYDALISKRVYKPPFSHKRAVEVILEGRGTHFDPEMVDVFVDLESDFMQIALDYADHQEELETLPLCA